MTKYYYYLRTYFLWNILGNRKSMKQVIGKINWQIVFILKCLDKTNKNEIIFCVLYLTRYWSVATATSLRKHCRKQHMLLKLWYRKQKIAVKILVVEITAATTTKIVVNDANQVLWHNNCCFIMFGNIYNNFLYLNFSISFQTIFISSLTSLLVEKTKWWNI